MRNILGWITAKLNIRSVRRSFAPGTQLGYFGRFNTSDTTVEAWGYLSYIHISKTGHVLYYKDDDYKRENGFRQFHKMRPKRRKIKISVNKNQE